MTIRDALTVATSESTEAKIHGAAGAVLRYGLVLVIGWIGLMKFTAFEAHGIQPLVANSPFMAWLYDIFSVTTFSALVGVTAAALIAVNPWWPKISALGTCWPTRCSPWREANSTGSPTNNASSSPFATCTDSIRKK